MDKYNMPLDRPDKILIISLPRGLYRLTSCKDCGHIFVCDNCDYNLTTVLQGKAKSLVCSECQSSYTYPSSCPKCAGHKIESNFGGRDYLQEKLDAREIVSGGQEVAVSNRLYDPNLDYSSFTKIIITHVENIFLGIDYTSVEDGAKSLSELLMHLEDNTQVVLDYKMQNEDMLDGLSQPLSWFEAILIKEKENREFFKFPPYYNILLFSASEKTNQAASNKLLALRQDLLAYMEETTSKGGMADNEASLSIKPSKPYHAKILRKKGLYTMHMLFKFPKGYAKITSLQKEVLRLKKMYRVIVRTNPRHTL
jgi:primosomal protein N' (replication factor Y) (superfamily II helicase)